MYEYNAVITRVIDGDTFEADIDLGFHIHIHETLRLLDIDTPEKRGDSERLAGIACEVFAKRCFEGERVRIKSERTDSFGRWLVYLWDKDGVDIRDLYNSKGINKKNENYSENNCFNVALE